MTINGMGGDPPVRDGPLPGPAVSIRVNNAMIYD